MIQLHIGINGKSKETSFLQCGIRKIEFGVVLRLKGARNSKVFFLVNNRNENMSFLAFNYDFQ